MKPAVQLIVTVLLVAGGIFVYDALVVRAPEPQPDLIDRRESSPDDLSEPRIEEAAPAPSFAVLEGTGDDIWRAAIERRLAELEEGGTTAIEGGPGASGPASAAPDETAEGSETGEHVDPEEKKRIERERFQWFRGMLEKVEAQRRWEKAARGVKQYLDKLDLALTEEQARNAVRTTVHYQAKWRQLKQSPAMKQMDEQQRRDAYQGMWNEYEGALRNVIPEAEVNVIVQSMQNAGRSKDGKR